MKGIFYFPDSIVKGIEGIIMYKKVELMGSHSLSDVGIFRPIEELLEKYLVFQIIDFLGVFFF